MIDLVGTYGRIRTGDYVVSCTDEQYNWDESNWWHTYLLCTEEDSLTLKLKRHDGDETITIRKEGYDELGRPLYHIGDHVTVKKSGKLATINRVCWHTKRRQFYYIIDYGKRVSSNWFFDDDIKKV